MPATTSLINLRAAVSLSSAVNKQHLRPSRNHSHCDCDWGVPHPAFQDYFHGLPAWQLSLFACAAGGISQPEGWSAMSEWDDSGFWTALDRHREQEAQKSCKWHPKPSLADIVQVAIPKPLRRVQKRPTAPSRGVQASAAAPNPRPGAAARSRRAPASAAVGAAAARRPGAAKRPHGLAPEVIEAKRQRKVMQLLICLASAHPWTQWCRQQRCSQCHYWVMREIWHC